MTDSARLVHMANQIAANLTYEADPAAATAEHIRLFWDQRMIRTILKADGNTLSAVTLAALGLLGVQGRPTNN